MRSAPEWKLITYLVRYVQEEAQSPRDLLIILLTLLLKMRYVCVPASHTSVELWILATLGACSPRRAPARFFKSTRAGPCMLMSRRPKKLRQIKHPEVHSKQLPWSQREVLPGCRQKGDAVSTQCARQTLHVELQLHSMYWEWESSATKPHRTS